MTRANARGWRQVLALGLFVVSCASTGGGRSTTIATPTAPASGPPSQTTEQPPAPTIDGAVSPAAATPPTPATPGASVPPRIAWVNPARCLATCAHDPTPSLVRVDEAAVAAAAGKHQVDATALPSLQALFSAAKSAGHALAIRSAFRSYDDQVEVFRTTRQAGRAARPGHSEHQLGTAIDVQLPDKAAIAWLGAEAPRFGFVISYPAGKQRITGYRPEPWHVRYVGDAISGELARSPGMALEELLRARPDLGESGGCGDCPAPASKAPVCQAPHDHEDVGRCRKGVLSWCYAGARTAVDCTSFGQVCGRDPSSKRFDCQDPPLQPTAKR